MEFFIIVLANVFLLHTVSANTVICGNLVDSTLINSSQISFSATSGDPGRPVLSGKPWKPTNLHIQNSLTVDLGASYNVSKMLWSGDPEASEQANMMILQYSYDNKTYDCKMKPLNPQDCNPYYGNYPPPAPSQKINVVNLGTVVTARYFRFVPIEPHPGNRPGSHNLRIDL